MLAEFELEFQDCCRVLRLRGSWELQNHYEFRNVLDDILAHSDPRVVLNLAEVDHIGSSIMGAIIGFCQDVSKSGGAVYLAEPSDVTRATIRLLHLTDFFEIYNTERGAIAALCADNVPLKS